ncbi:pentatricopeptide repeat-containing protein At3g24000, mitochondrial [Impatiens glandulifera]|uniref:pentatricopeptide repeat-containing protein At3g24000, mitochondrial n=1 Tax=Impatiens glandulifera TaxID=253017 RepID=UPI001FB1923D|nr:pentatricopeptide repeat-containing protein At3g24000, mitochondrial [Impatiens glandulifera]XP_047330764.1 pentatricopeptide repeat-containing protein At3g24000, mitochondrial [Impatiens glandulifera]
MKKRSILPCICIKQRDTIIAAFPKMQFTTMVEEKENDDEYPPFNSSIIQDKDLLRKSDFTNLKNTGLRVLDLIDNGSLHPDPAIYQKLFLTCTLNGRLREGRIVHNHFLNSPFKNYSIMHNTVLNMYCKCGSLEDAHKVFDEMPKRDMVAWTSLITGYSQNDRPQIALSLFPQMIRLGLKPNHFTFGSLLKAAAGVPNVIDGRQVHAFSFKYGYCSDIYVGSSLVDMYAKCGWLDEAHCIFQSMKSKNEVSWNALISGYARKNEGETAISIFRTMQREDFKPTSFTYSSLFSACSSTGSLEQGKWVHAHMIKSGQKLIAFVANTLIDMYAKSGSIEDSKRIFDRVIKRDLVSWNTMLTAFSQHGFGMETVNWFEKMIEIGIEPNAITFLCVLTACSHSGLVEKGERYFELMKQYEIDRDMSHYVTMVDLLGRNGKLNRAEQFIREMPIIPSAAVWGALLGACRIHKNAELGVYAAERVFELDPFDSGPHIILYNIYASAGKWDDAAKVRKAMKESGLKKEPACSWVEIENVVHMFVAGDDAHSRNEEIRAKWDEISVLIKEIGYVPDTSHVLLFIDEKEREMKLRNHSEKMALSFSLLHTPPGSTIRIKKNIRVCGDCHSAFKFVSRVVGREIILRDTNRFHHFRDGSCSCKDYW